MSDFNCIKPIYLDTIYQREDMMPLADILSGFNMYYLSYCGSRQLTRLQVPNHLRRDGLWITYKLYDDTIITEWYNSDLIDDDNFKLDKYWKDGTNHLVGDITIGSNGNWYINGEDSGFTARGEKGDTILVRVNVVDKVIEYSYNGKIWKTMFSLDLITPVITFSPVKYLEPGQFPTVENIGDSFNIELQFGLPTSPKVNIGTVTYSKGAAPQVTNSGTQYNAILDFILPATNTIAVGEVTYRKGASPQITNSGTQYDAILDFVLPDTNTVNVGTTTTTPQGTKAKVTNGGTAFDAVFNFSIPQGEKGVKGDKGDGWSILGFKDNEEALPDDGSLGDTYLVGTTSPYHVYMHNGTTFVDVGTATEIKAGVFDGGRADTQYGGARVIDCGGAE